MDMPLHLPRRRYLFIAGLGLALVAAVGFGPAYFSFNARFARSKAELNACAARVMATAPAAPLALPDSLGAFEISEGERLPCGFLFRADFGHPLDWNGLAYSTISLPSRRADHAPFQAITFTPLGGNWYAVGRD
jgi:hypothetical protein